MRPGRGNFAVVVHEKSLFCGILIGSKSLFCFVHSHQMITCKLGFEVYDAPRRSLLNQAAAEDAARAAVHESSDTVHSQKAQFQAPPDNPATGGTYHSREREAVLARK